MSSAKVIFTYKRKRLSSRSGAGHEDGCADFPLDDQVDRHQDASNKKIKSPKKDMMISKCANCNDVNCSKNYASCLESSDNQRLYCQPQHVSCGEKLPATCSSLALHNSSGLGEKYGVQGSDMKDLGNMALGFNESPGDNTLNKSGKSVSLGVSVEKTTSSLEKDSCSHVEIEGSLQGGPVSQSLEKDSSPLTKQECVSKVEVAKGQSNAPLLTFRRRLKRKADVCDKGMFTKQPHGERDATIRVCDSRPFLSCSCDEVSKPVDIKVERSDADMQNMLNQSNAIMLSNENGDSSFPCGQPSAENLNLRHSNSGEGLVVDASPVTQTTAVMTSGSIASALNNPDTVGITSLHKDDVRCCSYEGTVVSSCNKACNTDDQPVSQHVRASSGESQLTSSDSSDLKIGAGKRVEHGARSNSLDLSCPPPGAFVIDCNMVPVSDDVQEDASDIIKDSSIAKPSEKLIQKGGMKSKNLDLFGDDNMQLEDSPDGVCTSNKVTIKPETKCLQLFSEDEKCGQCTASSTFSVFGHSKAHQNAASAPDSQWHKVDHSSSKASPILGLSLPMELTHEGQMSDDGPPIQQFLNPNVRPCKLIYNPAVQSFPNQKSSRHKQLLESINTRATSLRGNRNISLDKLEPYPAVWSEEELDSLWVGIRRHGRGNWHAMLLDPRLRFAPWRVAGDLEDQWDREHQRLFSGQLMPSSRCLKAQDAYQLQCHGPTPVIFHGTGRRENYAAETQLSLGDVYAQKNGATLKGNAPSFGMAQAQRHVTMACCSAASYDLGPFNNVQTSVIVRGGISSDGASMAFGMNNNISHWHRDPVIFSSRPLDPPIPPFSTPPQMGGSQLFHAFPETSCWGTNHINTRLAGVHPPSHIRRGGSLIRKPGTADNLIVIDSDASSEETISDDNNNDNKK